MANKSKKKVSNIMLVLICVMIIAYAVATFVLQYLVGIEVSPTLTTAWFAFWGVELINLAAIKTSKIKHGQDTAEDVPVTDEELFEEVNQDG